MKRDPLDTLNLIAQTIYDKKGINILALDVRGVSFMTDYVIIAEGNVDRHVSAIGKAIIEALEKKGEVVEHTEGVKEGEWAVLDLFDIMVHLFQPGLRDKYQLEQLWKEGKIVDLTINVGANKETQKEKAEFPL
ncbi:MAG: ribosome silencing factor [Rhabdochlamydiaceae bacterium]|jgi:ribosome-associated protein